MVILRSSVLIWIRFSLRTFCRALSYASENPYGNELRSLYEVCFSSLHFIACRKFTLQAFCMSFLTEVDDKSRAIVQGMIQSYILGKNAQAVKTILSQPVPPPLDRDAMYVVVTSLSYHCFNLLLI